MKQQETKAQIHNLSEMKFFVNTQYHGQSSHTVSCNNNNDGNDDPNMQKEMYSERT